MPSACIRVAAVEVEQRTPHDGRPLVHPSRALLDAVGEIAQARKAVESCGARAPKPEKKT